MSKNGIEKMESVASPKTPEKPGNDEVRKFDFSIGEKPTAESKVDMGLFNLFCEEVDKKLSILKHNQFVVVPLDALLTMGKKSVVYSLLNKRYNCRFKDMADGTMGITSHRKIKESE